MLSRQYNSVFMHDDRVLISKEWSKVVPNISSKHIGKCLSTEHLMDYVFHKPTSEVVDWALLDSLLTSRI